MTARERIAVLWVGLAEAVPGTWGTYPGGKTGWYVESLVDGGDVCCALDRGPIDKAIADHIADAHNVLATLLDVAEAGQELASAATHPRVGSGDLRDVSRCVMLFNEALARLGDAQVSPVEERL